jgi:hypothetical protein
MSAAVPRDPAQSLHSAHRVLTRTAWLLSGPPEPQQPGHGQHSGRYPNSISSSRSISKEDAANYPVSETRRLCKPETLICETGF